MEDPIVINYYDSLVENTLGRKPVKEEEESILLAVLIAGAKKASLSDIPPSANYDFSGFSARLTECISLIMDNFGIELTREEVESAVRESSSEAKAAAEKLQRETEEKERLRTERISRFRSFGRKVGWFLLLSVFLGIICGAGYIVHSVLSDPGIKKYRKILETERAGLENEYQKELLKLEAAYTAKHNYLKNRFFGSLDKLSEIPPKSIYPPEKAVQALRESLGLLFSLQLDDKSNTIYDSRISDRVHILAKTLFRNDSSTTYGYLLLIKYVDDRIAFAHLYEADYSESAEEVMDNIDDTEKSVIVGYNQVIIAEHKPERVISLSSKGPMRFNKVGLKSYERHSKLVLREFLRLYRRGVNPPEK